MSNLVLLFGCVFRPLTKRFSWASLWSLGWALFSYIQPFLVSIFSREMQFLPIDVPTIMDTKLDKKSTAVGFHHP